MIKNRAFSQAGIYTLGYFLKTKSNKLATIILYKDLSAHVALATIQRSEEKGDSVGNVSYKLVYSLHPFNLQNGEDLKLFSSVFIATLKYTLY